MSCLWLCSDKAYRLVLVLLCFLSTLLLAEPTVENIRSEVLLQLEKGQTLADQGEFVPAVSAFNRAIGLLEQDQKPDPLLRERIEQALRITKGRSIVARYKGSLSDSSAGKAQATIPSEPKVINIRQIFGSVLLRGAFEPRSLTKSGEGFGFGRRVTVSSKSGVDLDFPGKTGFNLRAVDAGSFTLPTPGVLDAHSGAYLLRANEDDGKMRVEAPFAEVDISGDDPFAVMIGITTNGGLKMIGLLGEVELRRSGEDLQKLRPGQLIFVLPKGYSRKMFVELSTLIATADLLTAFEEPPAYYKRLKTEALVQALRTKRRFRTVVGDVKGRDSFEMKVLREDEKK
ncbi:MAG: hypothetical protein HOA16_05525 [Opitutae bacterium]|nr:hypothetical protein [Opitutae bacterium]